MNEDKAKLRIEIEKTRADAEHCAKCGNFYLADQLEKRVTNMVRKYNSLQVYDVQRKN